jgi:hypothetical protein
MLFVPFVPLLLPPPCLPFPFLSLTQPLTRFENASSAELRWREYTVHHTKPAPSLTNSLTHSLTHSLPLISNPPPSAHLTQTLLVLERKLPVTDKLVFAAMSTANTADGGESCQFSRVVLESPRAIGSRQGTDDPAWVASGDGVWWDVLLWC